MYNTEVGYCQGMSEIAAILLMYLDEEVRDGPLSVACFGLVGGVICGESGECWFLVRRLQ